LTSELEAAENNLQNFFGSRIRSKAFAEEG